MSRLMGSVLAALAAIAGLAPAGRNVALRSDHTVLVNGKPFFPVGIYYANEEFEDLNGKQLEELRQLGFNTVGYYRWGSPFWREELDRAAKLGMKVWARGVNGFSVDSPEIEDRIRRQILELRLHPALLFWEYQDEPAHNRVSVLNTLKGQAILRKLDPHHPALIVECPDAAEWISPWKGIGDLYAFDLYPVPAELRYGSLANHDITQIGDYMDLILRTRGDSPMLAVLQAWSWDPLKYGKAGYPTPQQSRFMAYQAVIHGAKGLFYYGQVHCSRPNSAARLSSQSQDPARRRSEFEECIKLNSWFWDQHRGFFRELDKATNIFVLKDADASKRIIPSAGGEGIEYLTKQSGSKLYLFAVNARGEEQKTCFRVPGKAHDSAMFVPFENRTIDVREGVFCDAFAPYDTHVYSTGSGLPR
jgi:hypothetical protein